MQSGALADGKIANPTCSGGSTMPLLFWFPFPITAAGSSQSGPLIVSSSPLSSISRDVQGKLATSGFAPGANT